MLPQMSYRERVESAKRPEEVIDYVHDHIWDAVNAHLGTNARSFPELVEQLGIMRFGHRPRLADTFCGSGQIPFEAARLGCDVYASDLNPVACMLTWGAFHIVGGSVRARAEVAASSSRTSARGARRDRQLRRRDRRQGLACKGISLLSRGALPADGLDGSAAPLTHRELSEQAIAELVPDCETKRYDIIIRSGVSEKELAEAAQRHSPTMDVVQDPYLDPYCRRSEYRTKISTLRGDYRKTDGTTGNRLRPVGEARLQATIR